MKNKSLVFVILAVVAALVIVGLLVAKNASAPAPETGENAAVTAKPTETKTPEEEDGQDESITSSSPDASENAENTNVASDSPEEEKEYTPTFMYFISNNDEGFDAINVMIDKLKAEYGEKVNFDIRNIDDDPELLKNFPIVEGNTPTLIMLNTKNEISNILFKTKNEDELKKAIDAALEK